MPTISKTLFSPARKSDVICQCSECETFYQFILMKVDCKYQFVLLFNVHVHSFITWLVIMVLFVLINHSVIQNITM